MPKPLTVPDTLTTYTVDGAKEVPDPCRVASLFIGAPDVKYKDASTLEF
jgi:hypothetical protein